MNIPDILVVIRTFADSISFKERDAQTIENGKTIRANVEAMTGLTEHHGRGGPTEAFFRGARTLIAG